MSLNQSVAMIIGMCAVVLLIGVIKKRAEFIINFFLRAVGGTIGIYLINFLLGSVGVTAYVGINAVTVAAAGILGVPGIFLLYSMMFYKMFN